MSDDLNKKESELYQMIFEGGAFAFIDEDAASAKVKFEVMRLGDREMAIVAVAELESLVKTLVSEFLLDDKDQKKEMLKVIEGIAAQARLAYLVRIMAKDMYWLIRSLVEIRNVFAHDNKVRTFPDIGIPKPNAHSDLLKKLQNVMQARSSSSEVNEADKFFSTLMKESFRTTFQISFFTAEIELNKTLNNLKSLKQ